MMVRVDLALVAVLLRTGSEHHIRVVAGIPPELELIGVMTEPDGLHASLFFGGPGDPGGVHDIVFQTLYCKADEVNREAAGRRTP